MRNRQPPPVQGRSRSPPRRTPVRCRVATSAASRPKFERKFDATQKKRRQKRPVFFRRARIFRRKPARSRAEEAHSPRTAGGPGRAGQEAGATAGGGPAVRGRLGPRGVRAAGEKGRPPLGGRAGAALRVRPWGGRPAPSFRKAYLHWALVSTTEARIQRQPMELQHMPHAYEQVYRPMSMFPANIFTA
jgi:hypothetical protein